MAALARNGIRARLPRLRGRAARLPQGREPAARGRGRALVLRAGPGLRARRRDRAGGDRRRIAARRRRIDGASRAVLTSISACARPIGWQILDAMARTAAVAAVLAALVLAPAAAAQTPNLVARYHLDGAGSDSSGNGLDAAPGGSPEGVADGRFGSAFRFGDSARRVHGRREPAAAARARHARRLGARTGGARRGEVGRLAGRADDLRVLVVLALHGRRARRARDPVLHLERRDGPSSPRPRRARCGTTRGTWSPARSTGRRSGCTWTASRSARHRRAARSATG